MRGVRLLGRILQGLLVSQSIFAVLLLLLIPHLNSCSSYSYSYSDMPYKH